MAISVKCPKCFRELRAKEELAGKHVKCPDCGQAIPIPEGNTQLARPAANPLPSRARLVATDRRETTPPPKSAPARAAAERAEPSFEDGDFFQAVTSEAIAVRPAPRAIVATVPQSPSVAPPVAVQVNIQQPSRAAHSLGIAATILGAIAFLICWIPLIGALGIPLSGIGLLLGIVGMLLAIFRRGSGIGFSIAGSMLCGVALAVAGTMTWAATQAVLRPAMQQAKAAVKHTQEKKDAWASAGLLAQDATVRAKVESVEIAKPKFKSFRGEPLELDKPNLHVALSLANLTDTKKIDLRGWGAEDTIFTRDGAELADEFGKKYRRVHLDDAIGQKGYQTLEPGQEANDLLLFETPIAKAKTLMLSLPAANYGGDGTLYFKFAAPARE